MADDILEIKPGFGPIKVNVRALIRRFGENGKNDSIAVMAQRFLQLFKDHGVAITQIPRLIPQLTPEKLRNTESLLPSLTCDVLESAAIIFGVRPSWLEVVDDRIYETLYCYKQPRVFFENIMNINLPANGFAVRAISSTKELDGRHDRAQQLALVVVEKVQDLGSKEITRYHVYGDAWDWSHQPCRIQLKAMARLIFQISRLPVPLHQVKNDMLQAIIEGKRVPHGALQGCLLTNPSLEDFVLTPGESIRSKEANELPLVLDYIRNNNLEYLMKLENL